MHQPFVFADDVSAVVLIVALVALVNLDAAVRRVVVFRHHVEAEVAHVSRLPPAHWTHVHLPSGLGLTVHARNVRLHVENGLPAHFTHRLRSEATTTRDHQCVFRGFETHGSTTGEICDMCIRGKILAASNTVQVYEE